MTKPKDNVTKANEAATKTPAELAAEQAQKTEQDQLEKDRLEAEKKQQEEADKLEAERAEQNAKEQKAHLDQLAADEKAAQQKLDDEMAETKKQEEEAERLRLEGKGAWLRTKEFNYTDPDTGIKYSVNAVQHKGNIREGSWLDCQIKAGLILEV